MRRNPPIPVPPGERYCFTCETLKGPSEFHRDRNARDGLCSNCKDCTRVMQRNGAMLRKLREETFKRLRDLPDVRLALPDVDLSEFLGGR